MKTNNQSGQSTIEFIFAFIFGVSLILMVFNSAMNYTTGYLAHYATFMASRTYLTSDTSIGVIGNAAPALSQGDQKARTIFNNYSLGIFGIENSAFKVNPVTTGMDSAKYLAVGTLAQFELKIDAIGRITGQTKLELTSESFLGHEPTRAECATRVCRAVTGRDYCDENDDVTLFDDGC